jgi:hypothetical protein
MNEQMVRRDKLEKALVGLLYALVWTFSIVYFWLFLEPGDAMGYSLVFLWIVIPVITIAVSIVEGLKNWFGRFKWFTSVILGLMYMLSGYLTFDLANNLSANHVNLPSIEMLFIGIGIALAGMLVGCLIKKTSTDGT